MTRRRWNFAMSAALAALAAWTEILPVHAVTIVLDYSRDSNSFFGAGNPTGQGAAAKAALQAAATFYSTILIDTLSPVVEPADFHSATGTGLATWDWSIQFVHPGTGGLELVQHPTIAADEYRLYVGGSSIVDDDTLGIGGASTSSPGYSYGGSWGPGEFAYVQQTIADFNSAVTKRGEPSGFATWGGSVTFDNDSSTVWHYNHNTAPTAGTSDFFSVAVHEIGHALGLGTSTEWTNLATGANFLGTAAAAAYGGAPPLESPERSHWASGTMSKILGTNTVQEAAMTPEVLEGTRKHLTSLDAGALTDIGWSVVAPTFNSADFNRDGTVNGPDLAIWRLAFGASTAGDANGDGSTDGDDFLLWQRRLGHVGPAVPVGAPVPEPSGAILAAWMFASAAARLRCRNVGASA